MKFIMLTISYFWQGANILLTDEGDIKLGKKLTCTFCKLSKLLNPGYCFVAVDRYQFSNAKITVKFDAFLDTNFYTEVINLVNRRPKLLELWTSFQWN